MISLLAEVLPDPNSSSSIGWVVIIMLSLLVSGSVIYSNLRTNPALHRQFVTREEFEKHAGDIGDRLDKIEVAGEARVIRLYDKIDQTSEKTVDRIIKLISEQPKK